MNKNLETLYMNSMSPKVLEYMYSENNNNGSLVVINNLKNMVNNMDLSFVKSYGETFLEAPIAKEFTFMYSFIGYDGDHREIYQIPEILKYTQAAFKAHPHMLYFLDDNSRKLVAICHSIRGIADKNSINTRVEINKDDLISFCRTCVNSSINVSYLSEFEIKKFESDLSKLFGIEIKA
ncbi:hypothetical protein [Clostridium sp.]|uniref:hypothetical protein n=1 Tax=Clostridium sp. TaxID=1506 RepID=UPI002FC96D36